MKKWLLTMLTASSFALSACSAAQYAGVPSEQPFVATLNQLEPSLTFFNEQFEQLTTWSFDERYEGAVLIDDDTMALYGTTLPFIALYNVTTGQLQSRIDVAEGTTNVLYDEARDHLYVSNKETNRVHAYTKDGKALQQINVGNYPMSMQLAHNTLYVLNFKSDYLSVVDVETFTETAQWAVPASSNGLLINGDELWIGGHGEHTSNEQVRILNRHTGEVVKMVSAPQMPVALAQSDDEISVISHGSNALHRFTKQGEKIAEVEIGANPFSVSYFQQAVITAGYDDNTLYVIDEQQIEAYETGDGPFQLVIRE